jgi:hypothetical protein
MLTGAKRLALMSNRIDLLLGLLDHLLRQRCVKHVFRHLLAVVDGPPEEINQRFSLCLVLLLFVDQQVRE